MSNFLDILKQEPKVAVVETKSVYKSYKSDQGRANQKRGRTGKAIKPRKTYDGRSRRDWAEHYGVTLNVIDRRLRLFGHPHPEEAAAKGPKPTVFYEGKSMREWADQYGVSIGAIVKRINKNGHPHPLEQSLKFTNLRYKKKG
jgi:hypothetical protein